MNNSDLTYVEKRSVRPLVLGLCFFWGLVLGFVAYVNSETFAQKQMKRDEQERLEMEAKLKEKQEKLVHQKPKDVPKFTQAPINEDKNIIEPEIPKAPVIDFNKEVRELSLKDIPEAPRLAYSFGWGLNGMTTYRPAEPVRIAREAPRVDFTRRDKPIDSSPINLNDIDGPEFEE